MRCADSRSFKTVEAKDLCAQLNIEVGVLINLNNIDEVLESKLNQIL